MGLTKPAAGVMATSPATSPDAAPSAVGLPWRIHSTAAQLTAPSPAATCVFTSASAANPFAPSADPALKPNQPNQSRPAPSMVMVRLCGGAFRSGYPRRRPSTTAITSALTPEDRCTTVPP